MSARSADTTVDLQSTEAISGRHERRKAQNRTAQRKFRSKPENTGMVVTSNAEVQTRKSRTSQSKCPRTTNLPTAAITLARIEV